jgi:Inner membrane protein YgaP-like, transmembrane domain
MKDTNIENITLSGRGARVAVGLLLISAVFFQEGELGIAAYLPLIAIYPLITATLGWDPIVQFLATRRRRSTRRIIRQVAQAGC